MGDVILIRHGTTEWSRDGRHTSYTDLPLLPEGEAQVHALAPILAQHDIGLTLCSPMTRARDTAKLAGLDPVRIDEDLHEWDYGGYEGISTVEIHRSRPGWNLWSDGVPPGPAEHPGETPAQIGVRADRVLATVDAALRRNAQDVVLVAHAHFLRVFTARYLGLPPACGALFMLATGTISRLSSEHEQPAVASWNERPR